MSLNLNNTLPPYQDKKKEDDVFSLLTDTDTDNYFYFLKFLYIEKSSPIKNVQFLASVLIKKHHILPRWDYINDTSY